jgi:hypothetical protein
VEGSCEYSNEPSGSIKCWEVLETLHMATSQEGLSSMKLVRLQACQGLGLENNTKHADREKCSVLFC